MSQLKRVLYEVEKGCKSKDLQITCCYVDGVLETSYYIKFKFFTTTNYHLNLCCWELSQVN